MRLSVVARHQNLTPTLRDHIERRFQALTRFYDRDSLTLHVELCAPVGEGKRRFQECRAQLSVPGRLLVVHGRAEDSYAAIDDAHRRLERELDTWRGRVIDSAQGHSR